MINTLKYTLVGLVFLVVIACENNTAGTPSFIVGEWYSQVEITYYTDDSVYHQHTTAPDATKWTFNEDNSGTFRYVGGQIDSIVWIYSEENSDIFIMTEMMGTPNYYLPEYYRITSRTDNTMIWEGTSRDITVDSIPMKVLSNWELSKIE